MIQEDGTEVCAPKVEDLFPAIVIEPGRVEAHPGVRAIIAQHEPGPPATYRLYVLGQTETSPPRPFMLRKVDVMSWRPAGMGAFVAVTPAGEEWGLSRAGGCGCHLTALKNLPGVVPADWPDDPQPTGVEDRTT